MMQEELHENARELSEDAGELSENARELSEDVGEISENAGALFENDCDVDVVIYAQMMRENKRKCFTL